MEKKRRDAGSTNRDLKLLFCRAASIFGILLFGGVNLREGAIGQAVRLAGRYDGSGGMSV